MKTSLKAAIYSGIVFPGTGYFIVHHNKRAITFILATLICLSFIMYEAYYKAQIIAQSIVERGVIPSSITQLREQILSTPGILTASEINAIYTAIIFIWLVGLVDSYRIGLRLDNVSDKSTTAL